MSHYDRFVGFKNLRDNVPWMLNGDAYTVAGNAFAGRKAKARSTYYLANRKSPSDAWPGVALDSRMVLYGVTDFIKYCLMEPITREDVEASADFMASAHSLGGPLNFDEYLWLRAIDEFGGNLPIRIEALPEGNTFFPNEPAVQVTSLGEGYGEIAAIVEANFLGMVACATARATVTRHLLERMRDEVRVDNPGLCTGFVDQVARFLVHDFGMRASSCPQESDIFGRAHLLSFHGTDTFNAAFNAWANCDEDDQLRPTGTSILAQAHRIINGYDDEGDAMRSLAEASAWCGPFPIASFLADTYDFRTCVDRLLIPIALQYKDLGRGVAVCRSDSGDPLDNINYIVQRAIEHGLYVEDDGWGRVVPTHLRFINGDSVNPEKIRDTFRMLRARGCNATAWGCFGIGGWLRRQGDRDILSSAYKLSAKGLDDEPVVKLSGTFAKMSIPGPVDVVRFSDPRENPTVYRRGTHSYLPEYVCYYDGGYPTEDAVSEANFEPFDAVRDRSLGSWEDESGRHPGRGGPECPVLSADLVEIQREVMERHGRRA